MNPNFPVYIISKGRWERRLTSKALEAMGVPYRIVIEPQEYGQYSSVIHPSKILQLPFSNLGLGGIPARNWVWEHALSERSGWHWILDDNITWFVRLYNNKKIRVADGTCFRVTEDFALRYDNVAQAGLQYEMFTLALCKFPPFFLNTRVYSCIFIRNDIPLRWRGRYNEDTDLSLRMLKAGWCTILINCFACKKITTMTMKGGNTDRLYRQDKKFDGRLEMAKSLQAQHPDVTTIKWKWGRWQHQVDYSRFKRNRLRLKPGVLITQGVNNYGMALQQKPLYTSTRRERAV